MILLAACAVGPMWDWWLQGRLSVDTDDVVGWLHELAKAGKVPTWTDSVRTRTAQGLLSTLRDFGVLAGVARGRRKEIAPPSMTPRGFAYVAWREHEQGASSRALTSGSVWRRWLLDDASVEDLLVRSAQLGVLRFSRSGVRCSGGLAGSAVGGGYRCRCVRSCAGLGSASSITSTPAGIHRSSFTSTCPPGNGRYAATWGSSGGGWRRTPRGISCAAVSLADLFWAALRGVRVS